MHPRFLPEAVNHIEKAAPIILWVWALGDRIQLQQVILNLLLNAIEAMSDVADRPRTLSVSSMTNAQREVLIVVGDSGIGLHGVSSEQLFEAFYSTKAGGMGIGLAVSRTIVTAHGGRLWATKNEPCGAVFQFTLPLPGGEIPAGAADISPDE